MSNRKKKAQQEKQRLWAKLRIWMSRHNIYHLKWKWLYIQLWFSCYPIRLMLPDSLLSNSKCSRHQAILCCPLQRSISFALCHDPAIRSEKLFIHFNLIAKFSPILFWMDNPTIYFYDLINSQLPRSISSHLHFKKKKT